ncbi:monoglyceride lipase-like [Asterias rubens]|uniref:monoglyceride lipase-like n=1 Tax=Asterias rubens TaxID=7604 RepID=UPI001455744E|nr:monoglyceride lipase-like [Asterias rubens]
MASPSESASEISERQSPQGVAYSSLTHFVNKDGQHIYTKYWEPSEGTQIRAMLHIVHGMGEHCERYAKVAKECTDNGILVFAHDHIGHGQSEGPRADVKDFQYFVRDCNQHIDLMRDKHKDVPLFMMGHSMGGTIGILLAYERPSLFTNTGVILMSPAIKTNPQVVTPFKLFMAKALAGLFPGAAMGKLEAHMMSRDPEVVKDYDEDPLVYHGAVKARFGTQTIAAMGRVEAGLADAKWPFLLQHGDKDVLAEISGSKLMYEKAPSNDKKFTVYEGHYHELDKEPGGDGQKVIKELVDWILERLPA